MSGEMNTFVPGGAVVPASKVELGISCRNLRNLDYTSKSDPMCVVFMMDIKNNQYREVGRTEVIKDCLNPDFVTRIVLDYYFEESQRMRFDVYDVDSKSTRLADHDFLGQMECSLGEVVSVQGTSFTRPLRDHANRNLGTITVIAEEVSSCKQVITMQWQARKLDKKDFFGKSDPFLVFYKCNEDGSFSAVWRTEPVMKNLNPTWQPFSIKNSVLCGADMDRNIKVECYDWDSDGGHDFIGAFSCTLRQLQKGPCSENVFECINPKKASKKGYKNSGTVILMSCAIVEQPTFLDYIQGGTQLHFTVAVDFTASNGDPRTPNSLHYMDPSRPNPYVLAIHAVGGIIQDYDADKMFPSLGFGARLPPGGMVSHEFFLNGSTDNPYCAGVEGILEAYRKTLFSVQLYGPTNFSPVINHVAQFASCYQGDGSQYFVLLIITDGEITDMTQTKAAIVRAASLPMSIIIVGVGNSGFDAMNELDGDSVRISSGGKVAERDIVQFVAMREFLGHNNFVEDKARLAKEVLAEIPQQLVSYMVKRGIRPKPRPQQAPFQAGQQGSDFGATAPPT
ncbi:copine-8-like isoform X2 [Ornithodoros turicata]|uniref:copine-8-like isoform X2 n=1 Tax=Ornithodoros turicata TaxID=34597 RepID=UPI003138D588